MNKKIEMHDVSLKNGELTAVITAAELPAEVLAKLNQNEAPLTDDVIVYGEYELAGDLDDVCLQIGNIVAQNGANTVDITNYVNIEKAEESADYGDLYEEMYQNMVVRAEARFDFDGDR